MTGSGGGEGYVSAVADVENALRIVQVKRRALIKDGYSINVLRDTQQDLERALSGLAASEGVWETSPPDA